MTGLPMFSIRSKTCWPVSACSRPLVGVCTASSLMSAPATKALSPAPVTMTTRTVSSCFSSSIRRRSSSTDSLWSALRTLGRLIVTIATGPPEPSRSSKRCCSVMADLERERIHQPAEDESRHDEPGKEQGAEADLFADVVLRQRRKYQRHEER